MKSCNTLYSISGGIGMVLCGQGEKNSDRQE